MRVLIHCVVVFTTLLFIIVGIRCSSQLLAQDSTSTSQSAMQTQKFIIIYKSSATEKDKERVRKKLNGTVTSRFADPDMEEVTIKVPRSKDATAITQKSMVTAEKDPSVQSVQRSAKYKLN
jgi:hypothetical protein